MLLPTSPPRVGDPQLRFPDGARLRPAPASLRQTDALLFGPLVREQAAWLGVPLLQSGAGGQVDTAVPSPRASLALWLPFAPQLARRWPQAPAARLTCPFTPSCQVTDASGAVLAQVAPEAGDALALAEVQLEAERPRPRGPQPPLRLPKLAYLASDGLLPLVSLPVYWRGRRRVRAAMTQSK